MEKINSIEQLRLQKELLHLQQMIAELRMKKEFYELKGRFSIRKNLLPAINGIFMAGVNSGIGKKFLFSTASRVVKSVFRKKKKDHASKTELSTKDQSR